MRGLLTVAHSLEDASARGGSSFVCLTSGLIEEVSCHCKKPFVPRLSFTPLPSNIQLDSKAGLNRSVPQFPVSRLGIIPYLSLAHRVYIAR